MENEQQQYVIYSPSEDLWWNNDDGWTDYATATRFKEEPFTLPTVGNIKCVLLAVVKDSE